MCKMYNTPSEVGGPVLGVTALPASTPTTQSVQEDLNLIFQTLYRLLQQQLIVSVFDHVPLRTMSCRGHILSSASGPSCMQVPLLGTASQSTGRKSTPATVRQHLKTFLFAEVFNTYLNS